MAFSTSEAFPQSFVADGATATVANSALDGTGTLVTVHTAGAQGSRIVTVWAKAKAATSAGMVRVFLSTDGGTTKRLLWEIPVDAVTPSATVKSWEAEFRPSVPLMMPAGAVLYAATETGDDVNVFVTGEGF